MYAIQKTKALHLQINSLASKTSSTLRRAKCAVTLSAAKGTLKSCCVLVVSEKTRMSSVRT